MEQPEAATPRKRILVVDDNRDAAESLGVILTIFGADVCMAFSGPEALEAFRSHDPALVLLDLGMPGMDGYQVARRLREDFPERRPAIVALTGWGGAEDRRKVQEAGFDAHLLKPIDVDALQTLMASLDSKVHGPSSLLRDERKGPKQAGRTDQGIGSDSFRCSKASDA